MISCYKLGPELTSFILNAFVMQFECSSKFLVLKISLLFYIVIIFAFLLSYCNDMPRSHICWNCSRMYF